MSINRWAAKTDTVQPDLVKKLRAAAIQVWVIKQPCDLLLRFWCNRHHDFCWQTLEAKTPTGKRRLTVRQRASQEKQNRFLEDTLTPIAIDFDSAWRELNKRHALDAIQTACVLKSA